jgi:hypothetical protein
MTRGQCQSPHTAPALIAIMTYYLSGGIAFGGAGAEGVKPPVERSGFLKTFLQSPADHPFMARYSGMPDSSAHNREFPRSRA